MDIDQGYAWVVMLANFGAFFVCSGALYTSGVVFTTLQERFGENVAKTALAGSIFTCMNNLAAPIGSIITDKFSCRTTVMVGGGLMTLGYLITAFSSHLEICILSFGLCTGMGAGIAFPALYIINGFNFRDKLNFSMGFAASGGGFGLFVMAPLFEFANELYGYNGLFLAASGCSLQLFVFASLMRMSKLEKHAKCIRKLKASSKISEGSSAFGRNIAVYSPLLKDKATLSLIFSQFFICGGIYTTYMYWPSLCLEQGFSSIEASFFLSISGISAIFGRFLCGVIASSRRVDSYYLFAALLTAFGLPCVLARLYASSYVGEVFIGIMIGSMNGAPIVMITKVTIKCVGINNLSAAIGLQLFLGGVAGILVPVICGYMVNVGMGYSDVFILCGASVIIGAALALTTKFLEKKLVQESPRHQVDITVEVAKAMSDPIT